VAGKEGRKKALRCQERRQKNFQGKMEKRSKNTTIKPLPGTEKRLKNSKKHRK